MGPVKILHALILAVALAVVARKAIALVNVTGQSFILNEMPSVEGSGQVPARTSLTTTLIERGCVHIRRLLSRDMLATLSQQIAGILLDASWISDLKLHANGGQFHCEPGVREGVTFVDAEWPEVYSRIQSVYDFHRLANDAILKTLIGQLLNAPVIAHPRKICRLGFPHSFYCMPPHTDRGFNPLPLDVITAWIPLLNCALENGILVVRDQPIEEKLVSESQIDSYKEAFLQHTEFTGRWLYPACELGDVVLFHSTSAHGSLPNRTDGVRLSVDYRYQAAEDPIHWSALLPHGYIRGITASWTRLTQSWPDLEPLDANQPSSIGFRVRERRARSRLLA